MAGTIPLSLTQQFDELGNVLAGGRLYIIQAGTTSTPQNAYQDSALTLPWPNPITLDSAGRLPQFFLADGSIKVRLTDRHGAEKLVADGILVIGASSGSGGGSGVDATTVLATGDIKARYGAGTLAGFVRVNGRTIGSATSGATERANADCQALFEYLWGADASLIVPAGRGASANADWVSNKTITLPDLRGRTIAGLDDMGNISANRLTASFFGANGTVLGNPGGSESRSLVTGNLPAYTPSGTFAGTLATITSTLSGSLSVNSTVPVTYNQVSSSMPATGGAQLVFVGGSSGTVTSTGTLSGSGSASYTPAGTFTGTAQGGASTAFAIVPPVMVITFYQKL